MTQHRLGDQGFVLVTSLLILVVLAGLGAGAFFLTTMNLRIAENTRTSAIAQYSAYEGVDLALIALAREYRNREDGSWPTLAQLRARMPAEAEFEITDLSFDPGDPILFGVVSVTGFGPRGSQYESSARFEGRFTTFDVWAVDPVFGIGWLTSGQIQIKGGSTFYIPLWAGSHVWTSNTSVVDNIGNFARAGTKTCKIQVGTGLVACNKNHAPPPVPSFSFDAGLDQLIRERSGIDPHEDGEELLTFDPDGSYCTHKFTATPSVPVDVTFYPPNSTICVASGVTLTVDGTATGLYVLGPRDATVNLRADSQPLDGVEACDQRIEGGKFDATCVGIKVAVGTVRVPQQISMTGINTIFAASSFSDAYLGSSLAGTGTVATVVATEGNIEFRGGGGSTLAAVLWANGSVCKIGFGGMSFAGTILALGEGAPPGSPCVKGIYWNGGGGARFDAIGNPNLPGDEDVVAAGLEAGGIRILARRP